MHIINIEFGGTVHRKDVREDGQQEIELHVNCPLFRYAVKIIKYCKKKIIKLEKCIQSIIRRSKKEFYFKVFK